MHGICIIDCMQSVSDRGITQITVRLRTGLAGEVTVTRERDAYSLARGIGDYYSLSFDLHQCMPLYLSRFQNHNRMYYRREDQIKAAKGVACWAPHCNKQRE